MNPTTSKQGLTRGYIRARVCMWSLEIRVAQSLPCVWRECGVCLFLFNVYGHVRICVHVVSGG